MSLNANLSYDSTGEKWDQYARACFGGSLEEAFSSSEGDLSSESSSLSIKTAVQESPSKGKEEESELTTTSSDELLGFAFGRRYDRTSSGSLTSLEEEDLSEKDLKKLEKEFGARSLSKKRRDSDRKAMREFKRIIDHPHIQFHPTFWKERFSPHSDSPVQEVAYHIYESLESSGIHPSHVSFNHFNLLYARDRRSRFGSYQQVIAGCVDRFKSPSLRKALQAIEPSEGTFSEEVLKLIVDASLLLECAVQANYWEDISFLVQQGGMLHHFGSMEQNAEWVGIYMEAYRAKYGRSPLEIE